jgi:GTP-binding protein HflX
MIPRSPEPERGFVLAVLAQGVDTDHELAEIEELARTAGVTPVGRIVQRRARPAQRTYVGKGKIVELKERFAESGAESLLVDDELDPVQQRYLEDALDTRVVDRTQLILDIFAQRAESKDGKLQVELAQLRYAMPRLGQKDDSLSRLTGGIGGRGPGETKLEIGRRRAKDRVTHLERQLKKLAKQREQRRRKRTRGGTPTVAIVGYTNAGKSTLLNTLTGSDVLAEDRLFATLETRSRTLRCGWAGWGEREVVLTDTVGFIRNLPKDLFAAFRSTFEEAADADLLLHVVDASDAAKEDHVRTVHEVLEELELSELPRLVVYNKIDLVEPSELRMLERTQPDAAFVSAVRRETTRPLIERIAKELAEKWDRSAKGPSVEPEGGLDEERQQDEGEMVTLEQMLRAAGKRVR